MVIIAKATEPDETSNRENDEEQSKEADRHEESRPNWKHYELKIMSFAYLNIFVIFCATRTVVTNL